MNAAHARAAPIDVHVNRRALVLLVCLASCKGTCGGKSNGDLDAALDAASSSDAAAAQPARCSTVKQETSLGTVLDVGDAVTTPDGFAVGVIRDKGVLSIALISPDLSKVSFADIGAPHHEASPPQPFWFEKSLYTAWIDSGELRLARLDAGKIAMIGDEVIDLRTYSAKNPISDLPEFDVATNGVRGIVAWEQLNPARGEIHAMAFTKSGFDHAAGDAGVGWLTLSPPSSDADSPRLAPRGDGYWITWSARAPEPEVDSGIEGPGESPSYRWLEAATLDANGSRTGDPKKLTPTQGHVAGFDVVTHDGASEIVARDAEESSPDEGTTLFRITLADKPSLVDPIANAGIGRAVPVALASQTTSWALVPDTSDATMLFPISPAKGAASNEPLLKGARPLAIRDAGAGAEILAVRLPEAQASAGEAIILLISCGR